MKFCKWKCSTDFVTWICIFFYETYIGMAQTFGELLYTKSKNRVIVWTWVLEKFIIVAVAVRLTNYRSILCPKFRDVRYLEERRKKTQVFSQKSLLWWCNLNLATFIIWLFALLNSTSIDFRVRSLTKENNE